MLHTSVKLHTWNVIIVYHVSRYVCHSGLQSIVPQWYSFSNIVRGYFGICFLGILMCIAAYPHWNVFSVIKHLPSLCPSTQTPSSPSTWHQHEVLQLSIVMREPCKKCRTFIGDTQMCDSSLSWTCSNMYFRMFPISSQIRDWECLYLLKSFLLLKCSIHIFI